MGMPERKYPLRSALLWIFVLAAVLRIAYVAWAPGMLVSDDVMYMSLAERLLDGHGYTEGDGSPAVFWMPGWPVIIAAISSVFGPDPRAVMFANALFGSVTACLVAIIGASLVSHRTGVLAGFLYAVWPGTIYFTATGMVETAFNFFLCLCLAAFSRLPLIEGGHRTIWLLAGGAAFGICALLKAEPLVLTPFLIVFLWTARKSQRGFAAEAGMLVLMLALVLSGWVYRNYVSLDRFLVTSATGGLNFWIGNHPGSTGGNDLGAEIAFRDRFEAPTAAERNLLQNDAGWRIGWEHVRSHPMDVLRTLPNKLAITYGSDSAGAFNLVGAGVLRGFGIPVTKEELRRSRVSPATRERIHSIGDRFWFAMLLLAASCAPFLRNWPLSSCVLVLSVPAAWLLIHLLFLGGARFHVPEVPSIAILAAGAIEGWGRVARRSPFFRRAVFPA